MLGGMVVNCSHIVSLTYWKHLNMILQVSNQYVASNIRKRKNARFQLEIPSIWAGFRFLWGGD